MSVETIMGYFGKLFSKASVDIVIFVGLIIVLGQYDYIDVDQVELLMRLMLVVGFLVIVVKMAVSLWVAMSDQIAEQLWKNKHYDGPTGGIQQSDVLQSPTEIAISTVAGIAKLGANKIAEKAAESELKAEKIKIIKEDLIKEGILDP